MDKPQAVSQSLDSCQLQSIVDRGGLSANCDFH